MIVPEGAHVRAVFLDHVSGLLAGVHSAQSTSSSTPTPSPTSPPGPIQATRKTYIDCSTIDPATSRAIASAVAVAGAGADARAPYFFDAPVSGGTAGAERGTLTFMCGVAPPPSSSPSPSPSSSPTDVNLAASSSTSADAAATHFATHITPLLRLMGRAIACVGGPGLGLAAKLCNNYLSGVIAIATSEAMNLGMRMGIDARVLSGVFRSSSAGNWVNGEFVVWLRS